MRFQGFVVLELLVGMFFAHILQTGWSKSSGSPSLLALKPKCAQMFYTSLLRSTVTMKKARGEEQRLPTHPQPVGYRIYSWPQSTLFTPPLPFLNWLIWPSKILSLLSVIERICWLRHIKRWLERGGEYNFNRRTKLAKQYHTNQ